MTVPEVLEDTCRCTGGESHLVNAALANGWRRVLSAEQKAALAKPLQRGRVKSRNQSGRSFSYLEGYDVIDTANELFGFDGWSMEVKDVQLVRTDKNSLYQAIVGIHVGSTYREDVGLGISAGDSQEAQETAVTGAVTDAMKRAFRTFGPQFGNSLYDKDGPELADPEPEFGVCPTHNEPYVKGKTGVIGHVLEGNKPCLKEAVVA